MAGTWPAETPMGSFQQVTPQEDTDQLILTTVTGTMTLLSDFECQAENTGDFARSDAIFPYDTTKRYVVFKGPAFAQGGDHLIGLVDAAGPTVSFGVGIFRNGVNTDYKLGSLLTLDNTGDIAFAYDDTAEYALAYDSNAGANGTVWFYENGVEIDTYELTAPLAAAPDAFGFYCNTIGGTCTYEIVPDPVHSVAGASHVNLIPNGTVNQGLLPSGAILLAKGMTGTLDIDGKTLGNDMLFAMDFDGTFLGILAFV